MHGGFFVYRPGCATLAAVLASLVAAALLAPAWTPGLRAANAYADTRAGTVAFAVRTDRRLWGRDLDRPVQSASVVKALLLVAYLRDPSVRSRALRRDERQLLSPMVRWSNNRKAAEVVDAARARRGSTAWRTAPACRASTSRRPAAGGAR